MDNSEKIQLEEVNHDIIRYANCWEEVELILDGGDFKEGERILSIASGGDNSFSLLTTNPKIVVAVDINETQLKVVRLKKMAIKHLDYDVFLGFLGFKFSSNRVDVLAQLQPFLSEEDISYWNTNIKWIEEGIIYNGKFENYFSLFRNKILPLVHRTKTVDRLIEKKSDQEQNSFYNKKWNTWRWKFLFKIFFSKFVMGRLGRDPSFLKQVEVNVGTHIYEKAAVHLKTAKATNNPFLHFIMKGHFGDKLPHYARKENFEKIKLNIDKLHVFKGLVEDVAQQYDSFDIFNLSNIFEYMDDNTFGIVTDQLDQLGSPRAQYMYWNLMVNRRMSKINKDMVYQKEVSEKSTKIDNGFFYNRFLIDRKK